LVKKTRIRNRNLNSKITDQNSKRKSGQPHGIAPTLGELEDLEVRIGIYKEKRKRLEIFCTSAYMGGLLFGKFRTLS
jgi:hypothetical protein